MAERRRLFFALWPDAAVREAVIGTAAAVARDRGIAGRVVPAERVHLTLHFLGDVERASEARLTAAAGVIRSRGFDLALDRAGCFYRSRVFWIGARRPPPELVMLWTALGAAAASCGIETDPKPLAPHLTCLRDVRRPVRPAPIAPIAWPVREFALVWSELGAHPQYHVVSQWPLENAPDDSVKTVQGTGGPE